MMPGGEGRVRCPRAWPHQPRTRAVRASCLPALRPACGVHRRKWVRHRRREARPVDAVTTKPGPGRALGMRYSPWQEPWWNAGRQARPTADGSAQADLSVARPHPLVRRLLNSVCRRSASFSFVLSYFVIAGHSRSKNGVDSLAYDPAIHAAKRLEQNLDWLTLWHVSMDHRVIPVVTRTCVAV